jgi:hypothetical protein
VRNDPKGILAELEKYALGSGMGCKYQKGAHKIEFQFPLSDGKRVIDFELAFEKGRKKSGQGLFRVRFKIPDNHLNSLHESDIDFLTVGFLKLIDHFARL